MIGTTAALILGGISAASKVASSAIQAHAAGKAADQQVAAGDRAAAAQQAATADSQRFIRDQLSKQEARMKPFVDQGTAAYSTLGELLGVPKPPAAPAGTDPQNPGWSPPTPQPGGGMSRTWVGPGPNPFFQPGTQGYADDHPGTPVTINPPGAPNGPGGPDGGGGGVGGGGVTPPPSQQNASSYARIQWPDGAEDTVPQEHLGQYQTLGAVLAH